jgi:hypothetical protein
MLVLKLPIPTEIDLLGRNFYWEKNLFTNNFFENERTKLRANVNQAALSRSDMDVRLS